MKAQNQKPHAILIAYPLQGHVKPAVQLAIKVASRGFAVTFLNTHSIHHGISSSCPEQFDIFSGARKSGLDIRYDTFSDGLPLNFDRSLNHDQFMFSILHVLPAHAEEKVREIVEATDLPVSVLIADTFFVWPSVLAKKFRLLYVSFWTEAALVFSLYHHVHLLRKNGHYDCLTDVREDTIDYIPGVEAIRPTDMPSYLQDTDTSTVCHQIIFKAFEDAKSSDFVICNTIQQLEPQTISALQSDFPFYAVGPVFQTGTNRISIPSSLWPECDCSQWLDTKEPGSVLYVSFGSYAHITKRDLVQLANGLLESGASFVWVLRGDIVSSEDPDPLPFGFKDQIRGRSIVIQWCRQIEVLAHPAVGGFLTHCGWNSVLESIWYGIPMICFPLLTDQFTNRKLVVDDWKIGINLGDGMGIEQGEVSRNVNRLMSGESSSELRENFGGVQEMMRGVWSSDGSSERNMNQFIGDLKEGITKLEMA